MKLNEKFEKLFLKYPVAISHLHQQFQAQRLGIVLGAGVGVPLRFPNWQDLVVNIATDERVNGEMLLKSSGKTLTSQVLFQRFKENYLSTEEGKKTYDCYGDIELRKKWKELVHDVLYKDVSNNPEDWIESNHYLDNLVKLIQETGTMTVTYNFDDTIERLLHRINKNEGRRGYTVVWDPNVQAEKRENIVYHPNGYLPRKLSEFASAQLVFLEDSFEDQLVESFSGHYNALNNYYSSHTCLFLGISLEDRTLKHMLRMNAKKCFGHMHYIIKHVDNHDHDDEEAMRILIQSETKANFETYNLFTLYLTDDEIDTLVRLIRISRDDFSKICPHTPKMRKFFIMGAVAVGKSTTVNQFKSFQAFDEWLEEMPDDMEKAPSVITDESENEIDNWVAEQINLKNSNLDYIMRKNIPCLAVIDRTPIYAFAFIEADGENENNLWIKKAKLINSKLSSETKLCGGKILFLQGDISEMIKRAKQKFRVYNENDLDKQQKELLHLAKLAKSKYPNAVQFVNVTNKSIEQVTKEVAEIIYFSEYDEVDFQYILNNIQQKGKFFI